MVMKYFSARKGNTGTCYNINGLGKHYTKKEASYKRWYNVWIPFKWNVQKSQLCVDRE